MCSVPFIVLALSILLNSISSVVSHKFMFASVPWRKPFFARSSGISSKLTLFQPRGGSEQRSSDSGETDEHDEEESEYETAEEEEDETGEEESVYETDEEEEESMWIGDEEPEESQEDGEEWFEPVKSKQHEVDAETWFDENQEAGESGLDAEDDEEDLGEQNLDGEEACEASGDDQLEEEENSMEEVMDAFEVNEVVANYPQGNLESSEVGEIEASEDDEGSSPAELFPEEPEARPETFGDVDDQTGSSNGNESWEEVQNEEAQEAQVFVAETTEETGDVLPMGSDVIEMELTQQHSTDDDSTAFVDRMELADAEDEGETTAGGFGEEDETRVPAPVYSPPESPAPTAQEPTEEEAEVMQDEEQPSEIPQAAQEEENPEPQGRSLESSESKNEKIDDKLRRVLQRELNYHRYEVSRMKLDIAAVVAEKRLKRPPEGMPLNWYKEGTGPDRFEQVKRIAGPVIMAAFTGWVALRNGVIPSVLLPAAVSNRVVKKKPPKEAPAESTLEASFLDTETILGEIPDSIGEEESSDEFPEAEEAPPPEREGFLEKLATSISNTLDAIFGLPMRLFQR